MDLTNINEETDKIPINIDYNNGKINLPMVNFSSDLTEHIFNQEQLKKRKNDGDWNSDQLTNIKEKIKLCVIRKCCHWDSAQNYLFYDKLIKLPQVVLSSILSTTLITQINRSEDLKISITYAVLSTFLTIMTGLNNFLNYEELYISHINASVGYSRLQRNIELILMKPPENRGLYCDILERFMTEYSKIRENSPFISTNILDKYDDKNETEYHLDEVCIIDILDTSINNKKPWFHENNSNIQSKSFLHESIKNLNNNISSKKYI